MLDLHAGVLAQPLDEVAAQPAGAQGREGGDDDLVDVLVADGVPAGPGPERALFDVAPTLLELLGEAVPGDMEGRSMLRPATADGPVPSASRDDSVTDTRTLSQ